MEGRGASTLVFALVRNACDFCACKEILKLKQCFGLCNRAATHRLAMDKFVVRTPRSPKRESRSEGTLKPMKQATIESLPSVVVVENILHLKCQLESNINSVEEKLAALCQLKSKNPSKTVMLSTNIGRTVNSLRRHENQDISLLAKEIFRKWKQFITTEEAIQPGIEVRCDKKTEVLRNKARKLLASALCQQATDSLPEQIERTVFQQFNHRVNNSYRKKMRLLVLKLRHNKDIHKKVSNGSITVEELCTFSSDCLTSKLPVPFLS